MQRLTRLNPAIAFFRGLGNEAEQEHTLTTKFGAPESVIYDSRKGVVAYEVMVGWEKADDSFWRNRVEMGQGVYDCWSSPAITRLDKQIAGWHTQQLTRVKAFVSPCQDE